MQLSIIIAAYNVELYIKKSIESCYDEELASSYEIIVVNDGSTDATQQIVESLSTTIPNLKIINKENEGLGAARNTGIEKAVGEYLWMMDGDDFIETPQLSFLLKEVENTKLDVYCMNYNITNKEGIAYNTAYPKEKMSEVYQATAYYHKFKSNSYTWQYIFKKSIFKENQLLFKASINMQDSEILPKIIFYSKSVKYLDIIAYNYVQHPNSFTNDTNFSKRLRYFESIITVDQSLEAFKNKIRNKNPELAEAIQNKQIDLHQIVFNHLVFFSYTKKNLKSILSYLKENNFYPLKYSPSGKMKLVKLGLNNFPFITKVFADKIQKK